LIVRVPITTIQGDDWLILSGFDNKVVFRAASIQKRKDRVTDPSGHRMDEAIAEGSVKCKPKHFNASQFSE